jgi:hypothetical protein
MATENHSVNIYLNEAAVETSLQKMQAQATKLEEQMTKAANPAEWAKLDKQLQETNGKIDVLGKQLSGEIAPSIKQMEAGVTKLRNELKNTATNTQEFTDKAKKLSEAETALKKVQAEAFGVSKAIAETGKGAGIFETLKDKIMGFANTIPGLGQVLNIALGPIGVFVGILTGLWALLNKNAEFADKFSYVMGGLNKIVHTLADDLYNLVTKGLGGLKAALENPKQALLDFGNAIEENIINHFKALGVIIDAVTTGDFKKLGDGVIQLVTGVTNGTDKIQKFGEHIAKAGEEGYDAAKKLDEMTTQQAELRNAIARTQISIEQQTTAMKDATLTDEERLAAAKKVVELETLNANRRISSIQLELNALKVKTAGIKLSNEEEAQLMDLQTAKIQEIANKEAAIRKAKNKVAELEAAATAKSLKEAMLIEGITPITEAAVKASATIGDFIKKTTGTLVEGIKTYASYGSMQFEKFQKEWSGTVSAAAAGATQIISGITSAFTASGDRELAHEKKNNDAKKKDLDYLLAHKKISQETYNKKIAAIDAEYAEKERQQKKKAFIAEKAAKIVSTIISVAAGIAAQFQAGPAGIALAAIAAAMGAAQIAFIAAQPVPEFAQGGLLKGRSHSQGGMPVLGYDGRPVAELEGDEFIVNKRATAKHLGLLQAINGGAGPATFGPLPKFNFGGMFNAMQVTRYAQGGVFNTQSSDMQTAVMSQLLDKLNQPLRAEVVYQDITNSGQALNRASSRGSFSRT